MKKYDIVATVGTYQKDGETKNRYKNVGVMMEKDGRPFLLLERTFNPAGMLNPDNRDTVLLSLYEPKSEGGNQGGVQQSNHSNNTTNNTNVVADLDDKIPF